MSATGLSMGSALRAAGNPVEAGSKALPTDQGASSGFPDLLSKMATAGGRTESRPTISMVEHRPAWGSEVLYVLGAQDATSGGDERTLSSLPASEIGTSTDAEEQPTRAQPAAAARPSETTFSGIEVDAGGALPCSLPGAAGVFSPPAAATPVPPSSPDGRDGFSYQRAGTAGDATLKEAVSGLRAGGAGVPQDAQEKPDAFAMPQASAVDAATPEETPRDVRALVSGSAAAGQLVSVLAQETHIAPAMPLPQGLRDRSGHAPVAEDGAPKRGAQSADSEPSSGSADAPAAGKPVAPSPGQPPSPARSAGEQADSRNGDGKPGSTALPADGTVSGSNNEPARAPGAAPVPLHQVAGQIVAAAQAVQRQEAQPAGGLAAKPASAPVVKILRLELQPADLGTISIRMSLRQDALEVRVEASRSDTARMLQRDQDALTKLLTSAGYRIEGMVVVAAPSDGAAVPDGRSQTLQSSSTPQHGGSSQPDSRSSGGRPNPDPDPRTFRGNQNDDNDKSRGERGAGGHLYV